MTPTPIPADIGEYLKYEPETGHLTWTRRVRATGTNHVGKIAGAVRAKDRPYIDVKFRGVKYPAARIAYFLMTGQQPVEIDHIDGDRSNNRWTNLRDCTRAQNCRNRRGRLVRRTALKKGVHPSGSFRFAALIGVNGRVLRLGTFETEAEAYAAYCDAARRYHGEFARLT